MKILPQNLKTRTLSKCMQSQQWHRVSTASNKEPILHEYFGKSDGYYLSVQQRCNQFSTARIFGEITALLRFTLDGRISNIFFKTGSDHAYSFGLRVYQINKPSFWNEGIAHCREPPDEFLPFLKDTAHGTPTEQYHKLLLKIQGDLMSLLTSPHACDSDVQRREGQLPLEEIFSNEKLCRILERTAHLNTSLGKINTHTLNIRYF